MEADLERVVRALQDPTRRGILLAFFEDPGARTVDEVAAAAGVHRTVAFSHLERLRQLGYLGAGSRRGLRGKPARLYRLESGPLELSHPPRRFQTLATLLSGALAGLGKRGRRAARQAGYDFGAGLAQPDAGSPDVALESLQTLGAVYELDGDRIIAANCVFREACRTELVCDLHSGLLEGLLQRSGVNSRVIPEGRQDN